MFIKLSYSANVNITVPLRTLYDIINTTGITSVSALQSRFTAASYATMLTTSFDAANSLIIRTTSPTNTKAHFSYWERADFQNYEFTLEQPVYDASSSKIYTQLRAQSNNRNTYFDVGSAITGGTITSSSAAMSDTEASATAYGTGLTLGGNNYGSQQVGLATSNGADNVRTFWAYVTDKCFFWATTNGTSYPSGWGSAYNDPTKQTGPFFQTQYTRFDYHNSDSNGIIPVLFTNQRGTGIGYGTSADLTTVQNLYYTSGPSVPLRVSGMVSALPQVGSAWPKIYNQQVHMTFASRTTANFGANIIPTIGSAASTSAVSHAGSISILASTRYPNAGLTGTGFGLLPFGWEANAYGNHGGNASDQSGVYIFNGDYAPGDTFIYNTVLYMIWPMYNGYSQRVGLAVPMV